MIARLLCCLILAVPATPRMGREMVDAQNAVRKRAGVPPLVWSAKLAAYAQSWADTLAAHNEFRHRPNNPYGENIFESVNWSARPSQVAADWAAEAKDYDYRSNSCRRTCGHYTQMVWRGTRELGCGVARRGSREVWVCNYSPAGNYIGQRPY